jgi:hypothetical protein
LISPRRYKYRNERHEESVMRTHILHRIVLASVLAFAPLAHAETGASGDARVTVTWSNPADFTETRENAGAGIGRESPEQWLAALAKHLRARADRVLPPNDHLAVTFTDVQRAGRYEPWRGPDWDDVRVIKDLYPPRIDLTFKLTDASGATVADGTRQLHDPAFLQRGVLNENDPLRFEKRLLDDWLRDEFGGAKR